MTSELVAGDEPLREGFTQEGLLSGLRIYPKQLRKPIWQDGRYFAS